MPLLTISDTKLDGREPAVCQLLYKFGQQAFKALGVPNDELNDVVQRIGTLCFCKQFGSAALGFFKHGDLEHHIAAQFGSHKLKAVVFLNHSITISLNPLMFGL